MNSPRGRQLVTLVLVFGAVVFGMVLAGGLDFTPAGQAQPVLAAQGSPVRAPASIQSLPSFADLSDAVLPAVVSIDAVTIERGGARGPRGIDPFEFFFGPRRQRPQEEDEDEDQEPQEFRSDAGGSGFVISADGLIVTNYHVIQGATRLRVHLGDRRYEAEVKGTDPETDLALIQIDAGNDLRYLRLGDSDALRVGDWVVAIGNPLLLEQTVTVGVVSAKGRQIGIMESSSFENFIQTDAAINRGNSGGPLVDLDGEVVGIATAMNWGAENIGFAVPINTLKIVLPQLREKGKVSRGYLGVEVGNIAFEDREAFGLGEGSGGVLVARVEPETPAGRAGLEHGDVILEVDGRQIRTTRDLIDYVSGKGPNTRVTLTVLRDGRRLEKEVELGERPGIETAEAERDDERESGIRWLGLDYQELTPNLRNAHGIPAEIAGVFVADVGASSPLFEEGVRPGDVIAEVNGEEVGSIADFERRVQEVRSGGFLRLYVRRFDPRSRRPGAFFAIVRVP